MNSAETLNLAMKQHQAGNLREAEQLYRQILQAEPRHADALHLLGVIAHQVGRHDLAVEYHPGGPAGKAEFCRGTLQPGVRPAGARATGRGRGLFSAGRQLQAGLCRGLQ